MACALLTITLLSGCRSTPTSSGDAEEFFTDRMREACPTLPDDGLAGYVAAVGQLRTDGLGEADALVAWMQGCESIPPDGNFQGDAEACKACLSVIVDEVYNGA